MSLEKSSQPHVQAGFTVSLANQLCLELLARLRKTSLGVPVLIGPDRSNQRSNRVSIFQCLEEGFEDENPKAIPSSISVGPMVKAVTSSVWRQHTHVRQCDVHLRRADEVCASDESL